jgi:hypothetical protein
VTVALYATIWAALACLALAEAGKRRLARDGRPPQWAWTAFAAGATLAVVHVLIALSARYGWDHEAAVSNTASQAAAVYGVGWRGSIYVSYLFLCVWIAEAWRWRQRPAAVAQLPTALTWTGRAFVLLIIVNGAIVFASPAGRIAGLAIVAALVWAWRPYRLKA